MQRLICLAGAGGVGKTSVFNKVIKALPNLQPVPSVVREFYAQEGVRGVADCLSRDKAWQFDFQQRLLTYYITKIYSGSHIDEMSDNTPFAKISDRSPFDHYAYCVMANPEVSLAELNTLHEKLSRFAAHYRPVVFYFPYPASWSHEQTDGFRHIPGGINTVVDSLIRSALLKFAPDYLLMPDLSIEERTEYIVYNIKILSLLLPYREERESL